MVTRNELEKYLNELLQPESFQDYVPNGLQVEGKKEIRKLLTSVSVSEKIIKQAVSSGADAILVHHGLFWNNESRTISGPLRRKVGLLLQNDITLFAYHLPLDFLSEYGNNRPALLALGANDPEPLENIGYIGDLPSSETPQTIVEKLSAFYSAEGTHIVPNGLKQIKRIAMVSGGGAGFFRAAIAAGADCFITGEGTEWVYNLCQENSVMFSAMGHYRTETVGPQKLGAHLQQKFEIELEFYTEDNPF